jgi:hypothetical protein
MNSAFRGDAGEPLMRRDRRRFQIGVFTLIRPLGEVIAMDPIVSGMGLKAERHGGGRQIIIDLLPDYHPATGIRRRVVQFRKFRSNIAYVSDPGPSVWALLPEQSEDRNIRQARKDQVFYALMHRYIGGWESRHDELRFCSSIIPSRPRSGNSYGFGAAHLSGA